MRGSKRKDIHTISWWKKFTLQGEKYILSTITSLELNKRDIHRHLDKHCIVLLIMLPIRTEWRTRIFIFLAWLNKEFKVLRSNILNTGNLTSIEEVYSHIEWSWLAMRKDKTKSLLVSRGYTNRKYFYCRTFGHIFIEKKVVMSSS